MNVAEVGIPLPVRGLYYYLIPDELSGSVKPGMRVYVEYGKRSITGIVFSLKEEPLEGIALKKIEEVIDKKPVFSEELLRLCLWVSRYYFAPIGEIIGILLSPGFFKQTRWFVLKGENFANFEPEEEKLVRLKKVLHKRGRITIKSIRSNYHISSKNLRDLVERKFLKIEEKKVRKGFQPVFSEMFEVTGNEDIVEKLNSSERKLFDFIKSRGGKVLNSEIISVFGKKGLKHLKNLEGKYLVRRIDLKSRNFRNSEKVHIQFTEEQQKVIDDISKWVDKEHFKTCLIHGVTGSGKTEVYLEIAKRVLKKDKTVLFLFPEIVLAGHLLTRITKHLGEVAVLHSGLTATERSRYYEAILRGEYSVVVGVRSAVFAPLRNVGLIVVDEEHENSFKQEEGVMYNARDVAVMRGYLENAVVILGSATPSLESYHNAKSGKYDYYRLTQKISGGKKAEIKIIRHNPREGILSEELILEIRKTIEGEKQVLLLSHRRGYAPLVFCSKCNQVKKCPNCDVSLTYHKKRNSLICHYCGHITSPLTECRECGNREFKIVGFGSEKVEEEVMRLFPYCNIARLDSDTASKRGYADRVLSKFEKGEINILIGTQMVAKGLDIPSLELTGVVSGDTLFNLPDLRASEKAFQLLLQVAGRSGRRKETDSKVIIQTFYPNHPVIKYLKEGKFNNFYLYELSRRMELFYPPYSRLTLIRVSGKEENQVKKISAEIREELDKLKSNKAIRVLGPVPAPFYFLRNRYRYQLILKSDKRVLTSKILSKVSWLNSGSGKLLRVNVDVDAFSIL